MRLMATPERIQARAWWERLIELGILRAMWRVAGDTLNRGDRPTSTDFRPASAASWVRCRSRRSTGSSIPRVEARWRRYAAHRRAEVAWRVPHRLGNARSATSSRSAEARRDAAVRVHQGMPARFRASHFGDRAARSSCANCDSCLGTRIQVSVEQHRRLGERQKDTRSPVEPASRAR